jgi:hypothetical protein
MVELIVTVEDESLLEPISKAIALFRGVSDVKIISHSDDDEKTEE